MQCREVEPLLPQYADDALPRRQQEEVAAHVAACAPCRKELAALARCLQALNGAAGPAPDLWTSFAARLAREGPACAGIAERLPAYAGGDLPAAEAAAVSAHLSACPGCSREEEALTRSLRALDGAPAPAPDLWPAFRGRLASTLSCEAVREALPVHTAGERHPQALGVAAHLDSCSSCAAEAAAYERALAALDRVPAEAPDLWPAMAARLEQERRPRPQPLAGLLPALRGFLAPACSPGFGVAAAAAGVAAFAFLLFGRAGQAPATPTQPTIGTRVALAPAPAPPVVPVRVAEAPAKPAEQPKAAPVRSVRRVSARRPRVRREAAPAPRLEAPTPVRVASAAPAPAPPAQELPLPAEAVEAPSVPGGAVVVEAPGGADERMRAEMVRTLSLFAAADDAVKRPFGSNVSTQ
jgi:anti-sigma factor RsiW